jgi:hypothetical protein
MEPQRTESPLQHLRRVVEESQHREIDRLDRAQRWWERKRAIKRVAGAPFRWLHDVLTGN